MDITRQLEVPANSSGLAGESEAVKILHRTLVNLREELIKRDQRIRILESNIGKEKEPDKGLDFAFVYDLFGCPGDYLLVFGLFLCHSLSHYIDK